VDGAIMREMTGRFVSDRTPIAEQLFLDLATLNDIFNNNWIDTATMVGVLEALSERLEFPS
jgi:hypothetical protein